MTEETQHLALFYDEACIKMLPLKMVDDEPTWLIEFGRLDAGDHKTSTFYIKNVSPDIVEQLEIELSPLDKKDVKVTLTSNREVEVLNPDRKTQVDVEWRATSDAKAAICQGALTIKAFIVKPAFRSPSGEVEWRERNEP